MSTVYFSTNTNLDPALSISELLEYYLQLVVHEVAECLNFNGINFIYQNKPLSTNFTPSILDNSVEIILTINSAQGPIPCGNRGIFIFFTPGNPNSKRLATSISKNIGNIYRNPSDVKMIATKPNETVDSTYIPRITIEICYVNDPEDIVWLRENIEGLSKSIVMSILEYFGVPYAQCPKSIFGFTNQDTNIMMRPALNSDIVGSLKPDTKVRLVGQWEGWYIVLYKDNLGYVPTKCITA